MFNYVSLNKKNSNRIIEHSKCFRVCNAIDNIHNKILLNSTVAFSVTCIYYVTDFRFESISSAVSFKILLYNEHC